MKKNLAQFVRGYLIFGGVYLLIDALIHLFDIKLVSSSQFWPPDAIVYAKFIDHLYASAAIMVAAISLFAQTDVQKYKSLIFLSAIWSFGHGLFLIFTSFSVNFTQVFNAQPAIYVWMPFYNWYLFFEAGIAIAYSIVVYFWWSKSKKS